MELESSTNTNYPTHSKMDQITTNHEANSCQKYKVAENGDLQNGLVCTAGHLTSDFWSL